MAEDELFDQIYEQLRRVAASYFSRERKNHTLQPTALVHEAWIKLCQQRGENVAGRTHAIALGAIIMRRLLVDYGRRHKRDKRGGGISPVEVDELLLAGPTSPVPLEDILSLDSALTKFAAIDPAAAEVVTLRFFGGLTAREVADHLGCSLRKVESEWTHAKAWLKRELAGEE